MEHKRIRNLDETGYLSLEAFGRIRDREPRGTVGLPCLLLKHQESH